MTSHAMQNYLACSQHQFSLFRVSCIPSSVYFGKNETKLFVCKNIVATTLSKQNKKSQGTVCFHLKQTILHNVPCAAVRKPTTHSPSQLQSHTVMDLKYGLLSLSLSLSLSPSPPPPPPPPPLTHPIPCLSVTFVSHFASAYVCSCVCLRFLDRLGGLVVKASASRAEDPRFESRLRRDFSGSSHTSDLIIGTPVATLPGAWHYRVSAGTGRPSVSIL